MDCSCLFDELSSDKGCFLCSGGVSYVEDCFFEFLLWHAPFCCDGDAVYLHVFEWCGGGAREWGELVKLVWASCLYKCLKKPTVLFLTAIFSADLPK